MSSQPISPAQWTTGRTPEDPLVQDSLTRGYKYDLRQDLENRAGQTRSIYGSWGRAPTRVDGYLAGRDKHNHVRAKNHRQTPSELRRDLAR